MFILTVVFTFSDCAPCKILANDKQKHTKLDQLPGEILVKICKYLLGQGRGLDQLRSLAWLKKTCIRLNTFVSSENFSFSQLIIRGWEF